MSGEKLFLLPHHHNLENLFFRPNQSKEKVPPKNFTFDGAYFVDSTTKQIYEDVGFALVDGVLEGYNGTG